MIKSLKSIVSGCGLFVFAVMATLSLCTLPVAGAPMDGLEIAFKQPDGTTIRLRVFGDEYYARTETEDGYTVVFDPATKTYYYATVSPDGNELFSTGAQVGKATPAALGLTKKLEISAASRAAKARKNYEAQEAIVQQETRWKAVKEANKKYRDFKNKMKQQGKLGKKGFVIPLGTVFPDTEIPDFPSEVLPADGEGEGGEEPPIAPAPPSFTMTGDVVGLMLLVDFSDCPGTVVTQAQIDDYCNKPNYTGFGNAGSIYDYWFIQSGGKLRYNNNVTYYVRLPQPKTYYNDTSLNCGICGRRVLNDALDVLLANGYDFSKLTTKVVSGKNYVRACNVFFAGASSSVWSYGLWPHRSAITAKLVGTNRYVYDYQITDIGTTATLRIGTVCHENGHMLLGYPDLYSYDGNAANVGSFSLMASGNYGGSQYHPTHVDPYLKEASGWMDIMDLNSSSQQRCTVQVDGNQLYRYPNPGRATEYFCFEVRDNTGYEGPYGGASGSVNPSAGLMTYHIYETGSNPYSSIWTERNPTNSYTKPYEFMLVEANQKTTITPWYDDPTPDGYDAFKSTGKSHLSDNTAPNLRFWDATGRNTASSCIITNISADSSNMTFVVGAGTLSSTPSIILSRTTLQSYCFYGTTAPSKTFTVCNGQGGTLSYTITDDQTWLSCTPASGTATTESDVITINFSTSGLPAGTYSATITVTDPAASPTTRTITVNLTVTPKPTLSVSPATLGASGTEGLSGPQKSFSINNTGGGSLNYTVNAAAPWLSFTPASGTVVGETDTIYVDFDATSLPAGTYYSAITVTSAQADNSPLTIPVTFQVQSTDMILTSPNGGEQWGRGETRNITWASSLGGYVKIELYRGTSLDTTISPYTENDKTYSWNIPEAQAIAANYTVKITSIDDPSKVDTSDDPFSIVLTLADALDTTGITWTNSGNAAWFPQTTTTKDGVDAAQSGDIGVNQSTSIGTKLAGPGTLTFWWKVSSELNWDFLRFYLNEVEQTGSLAKISGTVDWTQKTVALPAGTNNVRWTYSKDGGGDGGLDTAWLDMVVYTAISAPEIVVEQPAGNNLTDGNATVNFGSLNVGTTSTVYTFTVKNTGTTNLTGLALTTSGTNSADYIVGSLGATTLTPGGSTTFTVKFTPSGEGTHLATLQIANNDMDENPFDIALTGVGIGLGTLVINPATEYNVSGNYGGPFYPTNGSYVLVNSGGTAIGWSAEKTQPWINLSSTNGTLLSYASATVTVSIATLANTLPVEFYSDAITFVNTTNAKGDTTRDVNLTVNPIPATITFGNLNQTYDGSPKSVTGTTAPPGLAHTLTYTLAGDTNAVVPVNAGAYTAVATITQPNYAGSATGTLNIAKAPQTITFEALSPVYDTATPFNLTATASSGLEVAYDSSNPSVATVSGTEVTIVGVGTTTITASQAGDENYLAATNMLRTLTVVRSSPLAVPGGPYKIISGQDLTLDGSASEPSYLKTLTAYEWDLNNDGTFGDVIGATNTVTYAALTTTWGLTEGLNTIKLRVTDSAALVGTTETTVELVVGLTWDKTPGTAGVQDGAAAWLNANQWWNGSVNTNWISGASANFGNGGSAAGVTLASPTTVNTLVFRPYSGTYTLGTAGNSITLKCGIIKTAGSGATTLVSPIVLGGPQTWLNDSSGTITTANNTNLMDNAGYPLTVDGTGNTTLGAVDNAAPSIAGSGALVKNGAGLLSVGGINSNYSGTVTINSGVLRMYNNIGGLSGGNWLIEGGILEGWRGFTINRSLGAGAGEIRIPGGNSGFSMNSNGHTLTVTFNNSSNYEVIWGSEFFNPATLMIHSAYSTGSAGFTLSNKIDLNGASRTISVAGGDTGFAVATLSGIIRNTSGATPAGIIKSGTGLLTLSAANSFNGGSTINEGTLAFNSITAMPATGVVTVNDGAALGIKLGGTGAWSNGTSGNGTLGGVLAGLGGQAGSTISYNGNVGLVLDLGAVMTYSSTIGNVGASLSLGKKGTSTLTLTGNNTYTGSTILLAGNLVPGSTAAFGSVGDITFKGGTLQYTNAVASVDFGSRIKNSTSVINLHANGQHVTLSGLDNSNTAGLTALAGAGSITLSGTSTYLGNTTINNGASLVAVGTAAIPGNISQAGTLTFRSDDATSSVANTWNQFGQTVSPVFVIDRVTSGVATDWTFTKQLDLRVGANTNTPGSTFTWTKGANVTSGTPTVDYSAASGLKSGETGSNSGLLYFIQLVANDINLRINGISNSRSKTWRLGGTSTGSEVYGAITQAAGYPVAVTKNGSGTWILSGDNTYTGLTAIVSGKLFINGSLSNTDAALTVANGATLGGTGTIGRNVTVADGGGLEFNISTPPASHDGLTISEGRGFVFTGSSVLTITSLGGATNGTYTLVTGGNNIVGAAPDALILPPGWSGSVSLVGNSLLLEVTSVGEGATRTVTYIGNGNTGGAAPVDSSSPYLTNTTVTVLGNISGLVKTGYSFTNWNTQANGAGTTYAPGSTFDIVSNMTFYAQWAVNSYTVSFDANGGGTPSPTNKSVTYNAAYGTLATVIRVGYTFTGWFTAASGGTPVAADTIVTTAANHTLYAQWTPNTYTVSFDKQFGTGGSDNVLATYGSPMPAALAPTRTGYTFGGYYAAVNGGGTQYYTAAMASAQNWSVAANTTLYAKWTANTYTVTFNANGGETPSPISKSVAFDAVYGTLATVTRTNHLFNGWFTVASGGAEVKVATIVTTAADHTLYAQWTAMAPEMAVTRVGSLIADGGYDAISATAPGTGTQVSYSITNSGTGSLTLENAVASGSNNCSVVINTQPVSSVAVNAGTTLTVTVTPVATGAWSFNVSMPNNDADENPYNWTVHGVAGGTTVTSLVASADTYISQINVDTNYGTETTLALNSNTQQSKTRQGLVAFDLSFVPTNATLTAASLNFFSAGGGQAGTVEIYNTTGSWLESTATWTLSSSMIGSTSYASAASTSTETLGTAIPTLDLTGSGLALVQGWISTPSSNTGVSLKTSYNPNSANAVLLCSANHGTAGYRPKLNLTYSTGSQAPEMRVSRADAIIADGGTDTVDGTAPTVGQQVTYVIANLGNADLTLTNSVTATALTNCAITVNTQPGSPVAPSTATNLVVTVTPNATGTWSATVSVANNDADENPYNWTMSGTTANGYTVAFDQQSGTNGSDSVVATVGYAMPAASASSRTGYTFGGYYTAPDGAGTQYYTAAMTSAKNWDIEADTTLYAKWTVNSYTVTFDKQGGAGGSDSVVATYDAAMPVATAPSRLGYIFGGYYTAANGSGSQYYTEAMAGAGNWNVAAETTLYAKWTANSYTVTFNANGGGTPSPESKQVTFAAPYGTLATVTRYGYTLTGWFTAPAGGTQVVPETTVAVATEHTLYAHWTEIEKVTASVELGNLAQTYDGTARIVTATTTPTGLVVTVTYDGSESAPTNAGMYAVTGTVNSEFYEGLTNGTLVVSKATPTVTAWPTAADIVEGQALSAATLTGGSASVPGAFSYDVPATNPPAGVFVAAVTFTPTDSANYVSVPGTVNVTVADPYVLPFYELFEARDLGDLNGQNGWVAQDAGVWTNLVFAGTKAGAITNAAGFIKHTFNDARTEVWVDMRVQVARSESAPTPLPESTANLFVLANGTLMVFNGTNVVSTGRRVEQGAWLRLTIYNNYTAKTWDLYVNDYKVGRYGFYNAGITTFTEYGIKGGDAALDNLTLTLDDPGGLKPMPTLISFQ